MKSVINLVTRSSIYFLGYFVLIVLYVLFVQNEILHQSDIVHFYMVILAAFCVGMFGMLSYYKKNAMGNKWEGMLLCIVAIGFIMRVGYMLYTPSFVRQHDVGVFDLSDHGHGAYILHLFQGQLPDNNEYQFYHPPLYHMLSAITMRVITCFLTNCSVEILMGAGQIVSCLATCGMLWQMRKLLCEIQVERLAACISLAIVACFPNFYLMAGRVNNDALSVFFMVVAFRYTIRWYKERSWENIIILAFAYGLGMMTKSSVATAALFTTVVFLVALVKACKEKKWKQQLAQYVVFGAIALPLGLWFAIRNMICFGQSLTYVAEIPVENPVYCGDHTMAERLIFKWSEFFTDTIYNDPIENYNLFSYMIKSSLFGEFTFEYVPMIAAKGLLIVALVLILVQFFAMFYMLCSKEVRMLYRFSFPGMWMIQMGSFLSFNIGYPFACTMDFRYIPLTVLCNACMLGVVLEQWSGKAAVGYKLAGAGIGILAGMFSCLSIYFYLLAA